MEPIGPTQPQAGVMATRPAMAPEAAPSIVGVPRQIHSAKDQVIAAAAVASSRVGEHLGREAGRFEVGADVEAEPADPQQRRADHHDRQVVRRHGRLAVADALAREERPDDAGDAGIDVHDRAAREVERALLEDESGGRGRGMLPAASASV